MCFTGLGFPWLIASLYYQARSQKYNTPAGPLSFSVMIFMVRTLRGPFNVLQHTHFLLQRLAKVSSQVAALAIVGPCASGCVQTCTVL